MTMRKSDFACSGCGEKFHGRTPCAPTGLRDKIEARGGLLSLTSEVHRTTVGALTRPAPQQTQDLDLLRQALESWEVLPAGTAWNDAVRSLVELAVGEAKERARPL